jgi:PAS domain S-box-containing protein
MAGIEKATIIGKKCYETFPGPQCHTAMCSLARILNGEKRIEVEALKERPDKTKIPCIVTATSFRSHTGELIGIVEDFKDISKRKKAEEELRKSEEKLTAMLQSISDHISMIDRDLNIIWANDAAQHIFGENIVGKKCYEAYQGQTRPCEPSPCYTLRAFRDGSIHHQNIQCIVKDEEIMHFHCSANVALRDKDGFPNAVIMIARDITDSKRLELQFLQAQKMEAVGQLAGGIAHDFNNILTAIIGYGNLLQTDMQEDDPLHYYVSNILSASQKAANLTHALLAFSRKQIISPKPINVNETIRVIENLLLRLIGEDIELTTRLTEKELIVMADENQIEQVLMNLATNARDVMPDGGSLIISTDSVLFDKKFIAAHGYGKSGTYALISVTDTGAGMNKSTREKVFEPFFTTKEVGKGTGLGLAVVYGIIKQHEGYVNVYSEPGKGSSFKIYLPLIKSKARKVKKEPPPLIERGVETILLAEDDAQVRDFTKQTLVNAGYTVLEACDGMEAVRVFQENENAVDMLLLDCVMPKKNGKDVYEEIRKIRPGIRVLFASGYTADIIHKKGIMDKGFAFIGKPILPPVLLKKVWETLNDKVSVKNIMNERD